MNQTLYAHMNNKRKMKKKIKSIAKGKQTKTNQIAPFQMGNTRK
jgi:hypothetical protein